MTSFNFILNLRAHENSRLSKWEQDKIEELLKIIEHNLQNEAGKFLEDLLSSLLSRHQFIYFKNFSDGFRDALRLWVENKSQSTRLINYDDKKGFWQERQILVRYFSKKAYANLPSWVVAKG